MPLIESPVITEEVWARYNDVNKGRLLAAVFHLSEDEREVVLKGTVERGSGVWGKFEALFDPQYIAWAAVNFPYMTDSGGRRDKFLMVRWVPDTISRSTMKETVRIKTAGVMLAGDLIGAFDRDGAKKLQANDPSDLDVFSVLEFVSKFERDKVVRASVEPLAGPPPMEKDERTKGGEEESASKT
eukprot:CAMPEP_0181347276 /NCGR_PEP_ID=MMETSP1101-20121128/33795_1 /TAXON_ID=46948 /ORGANISM="Rhodomonas abbreviata, Strain Caron Lab Isolate" /LENGTH=184 /DNA_ID=CAMNT_0023459485 /DNA_START=149 /DNA_END=699 /DNA_ORIENTATION=+